VRLFRALGISYRYLAPLPTGIRDKGGFFSQSPDPPYPGSDAVGNRCLRPFLPRCGRQADHEPGALARRGNRLDGAAVLLDDAVADGKSQSRALADGLGGEKRFEHLVLDLGGNAVAGVGDLGRHEVPVGMDAKGDAFLAGCARAGNAVLNGVPGVDEQVHEDLFQPVGLGRDRRQVRGDVGRNFDVAHGELLGEQLHGPRQHRAEVHRSHREVGFAAEFPHVVDDPGGAGDVAADALGHLLEQRRGDGFVVPGPAQQVFGDGLDDGHGLVELVGHAGGHFAQGRHLARLDELLLGFQAPGDVRDRGQKHLTARIGGRGEADGHIDHGAGLFPVPGAVDGAFGPDAAFEILVVVVEEQIEEVLADALA